MAADELRSDPFAWAFARHHHQVTATREVQQRRRRLGAKLSIGAVVAFLLTAAAAVSLPADGRDAAWLDTGSSGSGVIGVSGHGGSDAVLSELRGVIAEHDLDLTVSTVTGRAEVAGRLVAEGDGFTLLDATIDHDFTASRVEVAPDASGSLLVVVETPTNAIQMIPGHQLACELTGMRYVEAAAVAEAKGLTVRVVQSATSAGAEGNPIVSDAVSFGGELALMLGVETVGSSCL